MYDLKDGSDKKQKHARKHRDTSKGILHTLDEDCIDNGFNDAKNLSPWGRIAEQPIRNAKKCSLSEVSDEELTNKESSLELRPMVRQKFPWDAKTATDDIFTVQSIDSKRSEHSESNSEDLPPRMRQKKCQEVKNADIMPSSHRAYQTSAEQNLDCIQNNDSSLPGSQEDCLEMNARNGSDEQSKHQTRSEEDEDNDVDQDFENIAQQDWNKNAAGQTAEDLLQSGEMGVDQNLNPQTGQFHGLDHLNKFSKYASHVVDKAAARHGLQPEPNGKKR